jgi:hypothetical protein
MLLQKINRTDPEQVFVIVQNIQGSTLTATYPACYTGDAAAGSHGLAVVQPATSILPLFAGVSDENIADDGYGRVCAYGVVSAVVNGGGNSVLSLNGMGIGPLNGSWSLQSTGYPSDGVANVASAAPLVALLDTTASGVNATKNVFVRAL